MDNSIVETLKTFIPEVEGFSPTPYWDVRQWSWGYGTAAGFDKNYRPTGSISEDQALNDAIAHFTKDYYLLAPKITINLNANQWSSLLSFSYNEGIGNAENLIEDINSQSPNLEHHFKEYIYSNHKINDDLVLRRNKEWDLWNT